jgi:hypothetical protein
VWLGLTPRRLLHFGHYIILYTGMPIKNQLQVSYKLTYLYPFPHFSHIPSYPCYYPDLSLYKSSRPALGPTRPPIQWVPGALSPGVKLQWREADHSPPASAEVIHLHGVMLNELSTGTALPLPTVLTPPHPHTLLCYKAEITWSVLRLATAWKTEQSEIRLQAGPGTHTASYPVGTRSKTPGAWNWDHSPPYIPQFRNAWRYTSTPTHTLS